MKKILSLFVLTLSCAVCLAQTVTLTFTGRDANNHYVQLSRVVIENATQNWQETITYPDTILTMGGVGIDDYANANGFALFQNNPNPFAGTTYAALQTLKAGEVVLCLTDVNGRAVEMLRAAALQPGTHQFRIQVANAGTYLLTARQNGRTSSIKMVNNGRGAANKIEYMGNAETPIYASLPMKNTKGKTDKPFSEGDEMSYTGYATVNGKEYQSEVIRQKQTASEDFVLQFSIEPPVTLPVVTTAAVTDIKYATAVCGGNVTDDGGTAITARGVCYGTSSNPTVSGAKVSSAGTVGGFSCNLTGLSDGTKYYVRAYATNRVGTAYGDEVVFTTEKKVFGKPCPGTATVTDHEGNVYNTVQIGNQCWTKENMRCKTSPSTGTNILAADDPEESFSYAGKKAYYVNGNPDNTEGYGLLYNWAAAVDTFNTQLGETAIDGDASSAVLANFGSIIRRGICPEGWHIPTDAEWTKLTDYLQSQNAYVCGGDNMNVAKVLASVTGWNYNSNDCAIGNDQSANNATGFSAVPTGYCAGKHNGLGSEARFWSTTLYRGSGAYVRKLANIDAVVRGGGVAMYQGISVRCLKDVAGAITLPTVKTTTVSKITDKMAVSGGDIISDGGAVVTARGVCWSTLEIPTVSGDHTMDGYGAGSFTSNLTNLTANTTYYVRAYATNSEGTAYGEQLKFTTLEGENEGDDCPSTVTDHEGNVYNTVKIGTQCWTKENMRCKTSPSTGTAILDTVSEGSNSFTGKKAYYANGDAAIADVYGLLYNWCAAVDTFNTEFGETSTDNDPNHAPDLTFTGNRRGICPEGWHVPDNADWTILTDYVGSQDKYVCNEDKANIAKALASNKDWENAEQDCAVGKVLENNNATGFSALPAGGYGGSYDFFGLVTAFWSSTQFLSYDAYVRFLNSFGADVSNNWGEKNYCYSVRCVKD